MCHGLQTIGTDAIQFPTCESTSSVAETATGTSIDPSTAEVTRLQSLVSAQYTENQQLRAEIERLGALHIPMSYIHAHTSQSMPSVTATARESDAISRYLQSRQLTIDRILSTWKEAGFDK